jgi:hypothetical protein
MRKRYFYPLVYLWSAMADWNLIIK